MKSLVAQKLTDGAFALYGSVIDFNREPSFAINNGKCDRYHSLAQSVAIGGNAKTIISLGFGRPYQLPLAVEMMERHPFGSQAFIPLEPYPFLVIVAEDDHGKPSNPTAFLTEEGQGVNYNINTWHAVLTPLERATKFLIVDRDGDGNNLEEYFFDEPYLVNL